MPRPLDYPDRHPELERHCAAAEQYKPILVDAARRVPCPPSLLAAIGSRESGWGLLLKPPGPAGTGDHGHGRGLMQIDDRWHKEFVASGQWQVPQSSIDYAAGLLQWATKYFRKRTGGDEETVLRYAVAAYNAGCFKVLQTVEAGRDPDTVTTGGDYSRDVFNRAEWFRRHGWDRATASPPSAASAVCLP